MDYASRCGTEACRFKRQKCLNEGYQTNMQILFCDYILTMDGNFSVIRNGAVVFENQIIEVGEDRAALRRKYPDAELIECEPDSVLMPGLINPHLHLEFSKNRTTLEYGDFLPWLYSVME